MDPDWRCISYQKWEYTSQLYFRSTPHPVRVTTRIITFLVGNPYKPSFATVTGWGVDPISLPEGTPPPKKKDPRPQGRSWKRIWWILGCTLAVDSYPKNGNRRVCVFGKRLMAEIPNNHLGWCWNPINNGINYQPQLVSRISAINSMFTFTSEDEFTVVTSVSNLIYSFTTTRD